MNVRQTTVTPYALPLRQVLPPAAGGGTRRYGLLLAIDTGAGVREYGDIAPLPGMNPETLSDMQSAMVRVGRELTAQAWPDHPVDLLESVAHGFAWAPGAVRFGVETALLNAWSAQHGQPWHTALDRPALSVVCVNALVTGTPAAMFADARAAAAAGFTCIKVKVGHLPPREVPGVVQAISRAAGGKVMLRLDANRAWHTDDAVAVVKGVATCPIDYIEEPLRQGEDLRLLRRRCAVRLALDESLDADGARGVDVWVIKPTRCGGIAATLALAEQARREKATVVISSMFESGVGLRALFQIAALTHDPDTAAGLGTGDFLARDLVALPPQVIDGVCNVLAATQTPTRLVDEAPA